MKIAIVGCGIAGTAAAWQLANQGHAVTLFEQAPQCGPVGAGILLQPSGKLVLERLGLLSTVAEQTARIDSLHAKHQSGGTLVHLEYSKVSTSLWGLGVRRGFLFDLLFQECLNAGAEVREGQRVDDYRQDDERVSLLDGDGRVLDEFDILVASDGSRSVLRDRSKLTRSIREYPDAALWTIAPWTGDQHCLQQLVGRNGRLMGILPVGGNRCSFFWGLRKNDWESVRTGGIDSLKRDIVAFHSPCEEIVEGLHSVDDLVFATYRNAQMKRLYQGRVAFIGDAAHATSPHLGQGLNMALDDAMCLSDQLSVHKEPAKAFAAYEADRRATTDFYARLTGTLTPFFQTSNRLLQFGRDMSLPRMPRMPYVGRQMVLTMSGLKTGWLTDRFDPA